MQDPGLRAVLPILLSAVCVAGMAVVLLGVGNCFNSGRPARLKRMPQASGVAPIRDPRRRFDVRLPLLGITLLVFAAALLFLYPWAVAIRPRPPCVFAGGLVFLGLMTSGLIYGWRQGIFRGR
jgi:NADH:ubiquinone oxidoreductase subunit 3 (subunit A)